MLLRAIVSDFLHIKSRAYGTGIHALSPAIYSVNVSVTTVGISNSKSKVLKDSLKIS